MKQTLKTLLQITPILALCAATATAGIIRLAWDPPQLNGASVTNYLVEWRYGTQTNWSETNVGTNLQVDLDCLDREVWSFRARAQNARGISPPTTELRIQAVPSAPRAFTATILDITGAVKVLTK